MLKFWRLPAILFCLTLSSAGCGDGSSQLSDSYSSDATAEAQLELSPLGSAAQFEVDFMTDMIDHHFMAVKVAPLCLQQAEHDELRELCANILATQSEEIDTMQAWLKSWYGICHKPTLTKQQKKQIAKLAKLDDAKFEIAFMKMMIEHHAVAVREAEGCIEHAFHDELIALCHEIVASQSAEIDQMQQWLCEWYGCC